MSERALGLGTASFLRTQLSDSTGDYVGYQPNLRPPPAYGQYYVCVGNISSSRGTSVSGDVNDRVYTAQVQIWHKLAYAPEDRIGAEIAQTDTLRDFAGPATPTAQTPPALLDMADQIVDWCIESYGLVNVCNTYISGFGTTTNGFVEPFHQETIGTAIEKEPNIYIITITMSGIRRVRTRYVAP